MAKKLPDPKNMEFVPVKLRRGTLKVAKALAGWRGSTLADYIGELVATDAKGRMPEMMQDLRALSEVPAAEED